MLRKLLLAVSVGLIFSMFGCGGGGSKAQAEITTGTGFYVDSAVSGVKYVCGASEGTTDASGKFTFEVGKGCTFFLGGIKLRDVDKALLKDDGVTVYETNKYIAQALQSLDSDGNPTNGITISEEFVAALSTANITSLPTSETETTAMLTVIENAGGTVVTEADALSHALTSLMVDRELYIIKEHGNSSQNIYPSLLFNSDDETVYGSNAEGTIVSLNEVWRFDGNNMFIDNKGAEYQNHTTDYAAFKDINGIVRFYFDKAKAKAYLASLGDNTDPSNGSIISGNMTFIDDNHNNQAVPSNAWARIIAYRHNNEGSGLNCKINSNGDFGNTCFVFGNENDVRTALNDSSEGFFVLIYGETTGDNHYNEEEHQYAHGFINNKYWSSVRVRGNFVEYIDTDLEYQISFSNSKLTITFNKDFPFGGGESTGDYDVLDGNSTYWSNLHTLVFEFLSFTPGGKITILSSSMNVTNNGFLAEDIVFVFPD